MPSLPVTPLVMPSDLTGQSNGSVDPKLLSPCGIPTDSTKPSGNQFLLHHLAARSMQAMVAAVESELGIQVHATSTGRTLARQTEAFDGTNPQMWSSQHSGRYVPNTHWAQYEATGGKWAKKSNGSPDIRSWQGKQWKRRYGTAGSAVPGTSNHGWWLAVDFGEELDGDAAAESMTAKFVNWLINNAARYGWSAEDQSEVWHWRAVHGDKLPPAVLAYEAGHGNPPENKPEPPKPIPTGGLMVYILNVPGTYAQFIGTGTNNGVVDSVWWCASTTVRDAHLSAGALTKKVELTDLKNIFLVGPIPEGDLRTWTASDFAGVS